MNLIERVKNILLKPDAEWKVIAEEKANTAEILTRYVLPLAGAAAIAAFIGYSFIGQNFGFGIRIKGFNWGIYQAVSVLISAFISVFVSAFVVDLLAPTFKAEKNFERSFQLIAYSYTPGWILGLLAIFPSLSALAFLGMLYGLYLLYTGLPKIKHVSQDNTIGYFILSLLTIIIVQAIVYYVVIGNILMRIFGLNYSAYTSFGL